MTQRFMWWLYKDITDMIMDEEEGSFVIIICAVCVHKYGRYRRLTEIHLFRILEETAADAIKVKSWKNLDRRYRGPNSGYGKALRTARNMRTKLNSIESVLKRFRSVAAEETGLVDNTPIPILCDRLNDLGFPEIAVILANYEKQLAIGEGPWHLPPGLRGSYGFLGTYHHEIA